MTQDAADPPQPANVEEATPDAVEVQQAYVYLFLVVVATHPLDAPKAKIPRVLFPAAAPLLVATLAAATPLAVDVHVAYVYLLRVVETHNAFPKAKMPRVLFPAAEPE